MQAWQATVQDEAGNLIFNPAVTVYEADGVTLASIYNEDGSPKDNPFIGSLEGFVQFWAGPGVYKIRGANGGQTELWEIDLGGLGVAESALVTASDALHRSRLTVPDLEHLMSGGDEFEIGSVVLTRAEGYSYEVVAGSPDIITDSGVMLRVSPDAPRMTPRMFGAVGDGVTDDTAAWAAFQAAKGAKYVPAGRYLVNGAVKRFDQGCFGNGEFDDPSAAWDQPRGDRERDSILVHRNDIDANTQLVSPVIKTQTHVNFERDVPSGSFKHVCGAYHEATYDGYYNTRADTNQNFTVLGSACRNRMAGLFGGLAHLAYYEDATETESPDILTYGGSKGGCSFMRSTRKALYASGGYGFGHEVYMLNSADEPDDIPYLNNDEYSFDTWTSAVKWTAGGNAPTSSGLLMHGLGGKHGFWNGLVIGGSAFRINNDTQGVAGTVAVNLASHRSASGYADIGIKFRTNNWHTYFRAGHRSRASLTRMIYEAGVAGLSVESSESNGAYIRLGNGADGTPAAPFTERGRITSGASATIVRSVAGEVQLDAGGNIYSATSARFAPATSLDGTRSLGGADRRWATVFASTGTINTSDARDKTDIRDISDRESAVANAIRGMMKAYRFKDAVSDKGDGARIHFGVIAQDVAAAFEAEGLDPNRYALFCYDEWDGSDEEVITSEGEDVVVNAAVKAGNRYGIRYDELLAFMVASL